MRAASGGKKFEDHDEDMQWVIQSGNPDYIWEKWNQRCIPGICSGFRLLLDGVTDYTAPDEKLFRLYGRPKFVQVPIVQKHQKDPETGKKYDSTAPGRTADVDAATQTTNFIANSTKTSQVQ